MAQKSQPIGSNSALKKWLEQARTARNADQYDLATEAARQAYKLARERGDIQVQAQALMLKGQLERDQGRQNTALQHYRQSLKLLRQHDIPEPELQQAHALRHIADILRELGEHARAEAHYAQAMAIYQQHGGVLMSANTMRGLALLKTEIGELAEARALWQQVQILYQRANVPEGVAECIQRLAVLNGGGHS